MNTLTAYQSQVDKVAKIISWSKLKYSWYFSFGEEHFMLELFVSKWSKKHRVHLNYDPILETKKDFNTFRFKILIYDVAFEITKCKTDDEYQFTINGQSYNKIAFNTSNNQSFEQIRKSNPNLRLVCSFSVRQSNGCYIFFRGENSMIFQTDEEQKKPLGSLKPIQGSAVYNMLDNSANFYPHEFMFLANKEEDEMPEMVAMARDGNEMTNN